MNDYVSSAGLSVDELYHNILDGLDAGKYGDFSEFCFLIFVHYTRTRERTRVGKSVRCMALVLIFSTHISTHPHILSPHNITDNVYTKISVKSDKWACESCAKHVFQSLVYPYRNKISADELPDEGGSCGLRVHVCMRVCNSAYVCVYLCDYQEGRCMYKKEPIPLL